jgi:hypothetical protein
MIGTGLGERLYGRRGANSRALRDVFADRAYIFVCRLRLGGRSERRVVRRAEEAGAKLQLCGWYGRVGLGCFQNGPSSTFRPCYDAPDASLGTIAKTQSTMRWRIGTRS